jgi:hypothetical protein
VPDPLYVAARGALLDAAEALEQHHDALVVIGAHAVYLRVPENDLAVAPMTSDADIGLNPQLLAARPLLADDMLAAGFTPGAQPGIWESPSGPVVDLIVPEALAGSGRRAARLDPHGKLTARRAVGIEGCLIDNDQMTIAALDPTDSRTVHLAVAGPAALMIAKMHKMADRRDEDRGRLNDKDALDVFRLLREVPVEDFAKRLVLLAKSELAGKVTRSCLAEFEKFFCDPTGMGVEMVLRATQMLEPEDETRVACSLLSRQLLPSVAV